MYPAFLSFQLLRFRTVIWELSLIRAAKKLLKDTGSRVAQCHVRIAGRGQPCSHGFFRSMYAGKEIQKRNRVWGSFSLLFLYRRVPKGRGKTRKSWNLRISFFRPRRRLQNSPYFAYSSTREQSNKRSGMRLKTESETGERR